MTKNELWDALKEKVDDEDLSSGNLERWLGFAFLRLSKARQWRWNRGYDATLSLATGTQSYALPSDYLSMRRLRIVDGSGAGTTDPFDQIDFDLRHHYLYTWKVWYLKPEDNANFYITKAITASENGRQIQIDYTRLLPIPTDADTDMPYVFQSQNYDHLDLAIINDMAKQYWVGQDDGPKAVFHDTEFLNEVEKAWNEDREQRPSNYFRGTRHIVSN